MAKFDESLYLADMFADAYYPPFLVEKVKALLVEVVAWLEQGPHPAEAVQAKFDTAMVGINDLQEEFYENDSEIETVARDSIGQTVLDIIACFGLEQDHETLMQERDW